MSRFMERIRGYTRAARVLHKGGAAVGSILLYPVRRRLPSPRNQIQLKNGISIVSPPDEPLIPLFEEIWLEHCYLPPGFEIQPGYTVVDLGANVGLFTVWAVTRSPGVRLISVEPSPRICEFLRRNISVNKLENISVLQAACGGRRGEAVLFGRGPEAMNTLYSRDNYGSQFHPRGYTQVVTLDDVFRIFDVHACDLLKLDCEGAEYEILFNAASETLAATRAVAMEYHIGLNYHEPQEMGAFLMSRGFDVQSLPPIDEEGGYLYGVRRT